MKVLALSASPRHDGNSRLLAEAAIAGAREAGHDAELVDLDHYVGGFLRDCRSCRRADGRCSIDDRYEELFLDRVLPANALIYATPLYWYGVAGIFKTFLDRWFCYTATSSPSKDLARAGIVGKRAALMLSSEESYAGATLGVISQVQELSRYLHHDLVGVVQGIGNSRGEVARDPDDPVGRARRIGARMFEIRSTDYRVDTERAGSVWPANESG